MDFYIYSAGEFDPAMLSQVDTIAPDVQAAARYRFPYARICIRGASGVGAEHVPSLYCAFAKWRGWERFQTPGVMKATCGDTPGLHKAVCDYPKENPNPTTEPESTRQEKRQAIRGFCELTAIAMGMTENEVVKLSSEKLAGIANFAQGLRMMTLSEFMATIEDSTPEFIPGDIEDFDKVMCELNPCQ